MTITQKMKIRFFHELRGLDLLIEADYHFAQKSFSRGERFAEPDDEGQIIWVSTWFGTDFETALEKWELDELTERAHEEAHEQHAEQHDPEPYEFY